MNKSRKKVIILGSTGSIGSSTLDVIRHYPGKFEITGLAGGKNIRLLAEQIEEFRPQAAAVKRPADSLRLQKKFSRTGPKILAGETGLIDLVTGLQADLVVSAITGIAGLKPTLAALEAGKDVALANKESMVVAGPFLKKVASRTGARIIPVDSEHSAIFQCLQGQRKKYLKRVYLTASGGPFFRLPLSDLADRRVEEALKHPRWSMGKKVTIDSATLMNKGLELIEAKWLFDLEPDQLQVLIHPQSLVHALVEFRDGSILAELSQTDMRIPIQYALSYPERLESCLPPLNLASLTGLEFYPVEEKERYPLFFLARKALLADLSYPVRLNAANEVAVTAFLNGKIKFGQINLIVDHCYRQPQPGRIGSIEDIFEIDRKTRIMANQYLNQLVNMKGK
ncbi:MAG: 1-deoxy-D-xylulose-5-phosphate reductoisomerase [Candidatus Saccharicenans sp.]|nr:1-deoxy-D-xylulose-5-phosphate reductoisomerase [Candidatus Saccharicenans sp.]